MSDDDILVIEDLSFSYGSQNVLDRLSLQVSRGTILGIVGASGSGKTTLIRLIAGIIRPDIGSLNLFGDKPSPKLWDKIGYMPQLQSLYSDLTVRQNIDFFARMYGVSKSEYRSEVVDGTIKQVSLWEKRKEVVANLSGGERQRVSLGIALVHNPPLLLLDEPTVGLDPKLRADLWEHFRRLIKNGTTVIISSHAMEDASRCDRVGFLDAGRVIALGTPSDLIASAGNDALGLEDAFLYFMDRVEYQ